MNISVDIKNVDLGTQREITDVTEQIGVLCTAIAHADQSDGSKMRSLLRLARTLGVDAIDGAQLLLGAAAIAAHGVGVDIDEAMETLEDNMETCALAEAEHPRTS